MNEPVNAWQPVDDQPTVTPVPVKRRSSSPWTNVLVGLAVLVFVGGITFAIGRATAPAQAANGRGTGQFPTNGQFPTGSFNPGAFPGGGIDGSAGGRTITGTVGSISGSSLTLTTASGQTITIDLSGTTYHAQTSASASDVTQGATVQVTVEGFGGGASGGAPPSAAPSGGTSSQTLTATDVTIVSK